MARRSARSVLQPADSHSSASDIDGDETQRLTALASLLQKPKANHQELHDFRAKVTAGQRELQQLLGKRAQDAEESSTHRRNELTKAVLVALQTPNRAMSSTPPTLGSTRLVRNAAFKSVAHILTASRSLVGEYDRLNTFIVSMQNTGSESAVETWAEGVEKTAVLLRSGAGIATRNVKKVLGADISEEDMDTQEESGSMEAIEGMELNHELHRSLYLAETGVQKMVQGLPHDEER